MNNKKYLSYALFAMMLFGTVQSTFSFTPFSLPSLSIHAMHLSKLSRLGLLLGGPATAAVCTAGSTIFWMVELYKDMKGNREQELSNSPELLNSLVENKIAKKYKIAGALIGAAAIAAPALYWARSKIQTQIANAQQAMTKEAERIDTKIAKAADMSAQELQALVKGA